MAAGEPQSGPPPLPAKSFSARRHGQVNSSVFLAHCFLLSWLLVFSVRVQCLAKGH